MDSVDTSSTPGTSYDQVPYTSRSFPQSHPDRLATLARLFGMTPTPVTRCRVLEMGCAGGGNLIPMAFHLPDSEFVGVDFSERQIQMASETITALELDNIRVEKASIMDIDRSWGTFDYIICHGVFSWVADEVQEKILSVASANLAPRGVAYVSYNTYPGWHLREMIRNMMHYHIGQFTDTARRIRQARALIDFLADSVSTDTYYGQMLQSELQLVQSVKDWYLFHDHLEEVNAPLYFHEFISRAANHHLQYLGEADFSAMLNSGFPKEVAETLNRISPHIIRTEQYMDFLRNRFFRQTLLCHQDQALHRNLDAQSLKGFLIASPAAPVTAHIDLSPGKKQSFRAPSGKSFSTGFPLTKAALGVLQEHWPRALDQDRLRRESFQRIGLQNPTDSMLADWKTVCGDLLHCYTFSHIELHTWQADFVTTVSACPRASRLATQQIQQSANVTNQRHEQVSLDAVARSLVRALDGTKDHQALLRHLIMCAESGELTIKRDGATLTNHELIEQALRNTLRQALNKFSKEALLVG